MTSPPASVSQAGPGDPDPARSPSGPGAPDGFARGGRRHLQGCYAGLDGPDRPWRWEACDDGWHPQEGPA